MKIYYFISNKLRIIKNFLKWLNWAWVDSHAQNFIPKKFKEMLKLVLLISYILLSITLFSVTIYIMFANAIAAICILLGYVLILPTIINILEVPLKDESDN